MSIILATIAATCLITADETELSEGGKQFLAGCKAFQEANGGTTDCLCLAKKVDKDPELAAAISMITSPADLEAAPENVTAAIAGCQPKG